MPAQAWVCCKAPCQLGVRVQAAGDTAMLQELGHEYGLQVSIIDLVSSRSEGSNTHVSSSAVREALAAGQMARVADLLARPYRLLVAASKVSEPYDDSVIRYASTIL